MNLRFTLSLLSTCFLAAAVFFAGCSQGREVSLDNSGPLERVGASADSAVETIGEKSSEIAEKTAGGARQVTQKVGAAIERAGHWVKDKAQPASTPTTIPNGVELQLKSQ